MVCYKTLNDIENINSKNKKIETLKNRNNGLTEQNNELKNKINILEVDLKDMSEALTANSLEMIGMKASFDQAVETVTMLSNELTKLQEDKLNEKNNYESKLSKSKYDFSQTGRNIIIYFREQINFNSK